MNQIKSDEKTQSQLHMEVGDQESGELWGPEPGMGTATLPCCPTPPGAGGGSDGEMEGGGGTLRSEQADVIRVRTNKTSIGEEKC